MNELQLLMAIWGASQNPDVQQKTAEVKANDSIYTEFYLHGTILFI